jgi:hypothetical protein
MKVALISVHSPQFQELSDITWGKNKKLYCERHNYLGADKVLKDYNHSTAFRYKLEFILLAFSFGVDWVWTTGTDSMITDFTNDLSAIIDTDASFVIATDRNGINSDSYFIKNDIDGNYIINWLMQRILDGEYVDEQDSLNKMLSVLQESDADNEGIVKIVPQRKINSYDYNLYPNPNDKQDKLGTDGQWQEGDLLIHWPGWSDNPEIRVRLANEYLRRVKYE